jgi:sulfite reductase alpha subunit-like flavoprotein
MDQLSSALSDIHPQQDDVISNTPMGLPQPRVALKLSDRAGPSIQHPLSLDERYHMAKVRCNRRITSPDWYQDVRHMEFSFEDDIRYAPFALRQKASN